MEDKMEKLKTFFNENITDSNQELYKVPIGKSAVIKEIRAKLPKYKFAKIMQDEFTLDTFEGEAVLECNLILNENEALSSVIPKDDYFIRFNYSYNNNPRHTSRYWYDVYKKQDNLNYALIDSKDMFKYQYQARFEGESRDTRFNFSPQNFIIIDKKKYYFALQYNSISSSYYNYIAFLDPQSDEIVKVLRQLGVSSYTNNKFFVINDVDFKKAYVIYVDLGDNKQYIKELNADFSYGATIATKENVNSSNYQYAYANHNISFLVDNFTMPSFYSGNYSNQGSNSIYNSRVSSKQIHIIKDNQLISFYAPSGCLVTSKGFLMTTDIKDEYSKSNNPAGYASFLIMFPFDDLVNMWSKPVLVAKVSEFSFESSNSQIIGMNKKTLIFMSLKSGDTNTIFRIWELNLETLELVKIFGDKKDKMPYFYMQSIGTAFGALADVDFTDSTIEPTKIKITGVEI